MRLGTTPITDVKLGVTDVMRVMLGAVEVWARSTGDIPCNAVYYGGEVVYFNGEVVTFGTLTADTTGVSADSTCGTADFVAGVAADSSAFVLEARVFNGDTVLGLTDAKFRIAAEVYDQEVN